MDAVRERPKRWIDMELLRLVPGITTLNLGLMRWSENTGWEKRLLLKTDAPKDTLIIAFRDDHYNAVGRPPHNT